METTSKGLVKGEENDVSVLPREREMGGGIQQEEWVEGKGVTTSVSPAMEKYGNTGDVVGKIVPPLWTLKLPRGRN